MSEVDLIRCAGCGKPVKSGKAVRITTGDVHGKKVTGQEEWGFFHLECFRGAVRSPRFIEEELKRASGG